MERNAELMASSNRPGFLFVSWTALGELDSLNFFFFECGNIGNKLITHFAQHRCETRCTHMLSILPNT